MEFIVSLSACSIIDVAVLVEQVSSTSFFMLTIAVAFSACTARNFLNGASTHGKRSLRRPTGALLRQNALDDSKISILGAYNNLTVPKSYFTHMYVVGVIMSFACICIQISCYRSGHFLTSVALQSSLCFLIHCIRRLYECIYRTVFGDSKMHICGYLVGIGHYVIAPLCLTTALVEKDTEVADAAALLSQASLFIRAFAILIFIKYSLKQHRVHEALFKMKTAGGVLSTSVNTGNSKNNVYSFPESEEFQYVACPHYFAEIMIYVSFCVLALGAPIPTISPSLSLIEISQFLLHVLGASPVGWILGHNRFDFLAHPPRQDFSLPLSLPYSLLFLTLWVTSNLSVVADQQYKWYQKQFPEECKKRPHWKRLFPSVW